MNFLFFKSKLNLNKSFISVWKMKLLLINFRSFDREEIYFERDKLTLISGDSGVGKTTILMGIMFAFGEDFKDIVKHGCRKCRVILEIDDIIIQRQKGPKRVILKDNGRTYENKEADARISELFPHAKLGYVSQQAHKYFISASPKDQLEYIEQIAVDRNYVDIINEKCKKLIHHRKIDLLKTCQEETTMKNQLEDLGIARPKCTIPDVSEEDVMSLHEEVNRAEAEYNVCKGENRRLLQLEEELANIQDVSESVADIEYNIKKVTEQNFQWKKYCEARMKMDMNEPVLSTDLIEKQSLNILKRKMLSRDVTRYNDVKKKLKYVQDEIDSLQLPDLPFEFSESLLYDMQMYEKLLQRRKDKYKYSTLIENLNKCIPESKYTVQYLENIKKQRQLLEEKRSAWKRLEKLKGMSILYSCPYCNEKICLTKGRLFKWHESTLCLENAAKYEHEITILAATCSGMDDIERDVEDTLFIDVENELQKNEDVHKEKETIEKQIATLVHKRDDICIDGFTGLEEKLLLLHTPNIVHDMEVYKDRYDRCKLLSDKVTFLAQQMSELDYAVSEYNSIAKPEYDIDQLNKLKKHNDIYMHNEAQCKELLCEEPTEDVSHYKQLLRAATQKKHITKELNKIAITANNLDEMYATLNENKRKLQVMRRNLSMKEARESWSKVDMVSEKKNDLNVSYPRAIRLQALIKDAETKALENVIEQINFYTQMFVDRFIDNLYVEFSFKENNKMVINVVHHGHKTNLTSLSGGEYARVALAVTLAMAELHSVNILLLDESTASLDHETTSSVLESIKDTFSGTVLCVAHQTVKGMFDRVIEL